MIYKKDAYKYVKEQLDAREVMSKEMGEPDRISGENYYWKSPDRNERTASTCSNGSIITDFGRNFFRRYYQCYILD